MPTLVFKKSGVVIFIITVTQNKFQDQEYYQG